MTTEDSINETPSTAERLRELERDNIRLERELIYVEKELLKKEQRMRVIEHRLGIAEHVELQLEGTHV